MCMIVQLKGALLAKEDGVQSARGRGAKQLMSLICADQLFRDVPD